MGEDGGRSLAETPTWAIATVLSFIVALGWFFQALLKHSGQWLGRSKRKALLSAVDKIKEELMLFGFLSLLMGHWTIIVAKICVKSSVISSRFYPCLPETHTRKSMSVNPFTISSSNYLNYSTYDKQIHMERHFCSKGYESLASHESLEQLHRFLFVLVVTHVSYSFLALALAMIKIYSWRTWENQSRLTAMHELQGPPQTAPHSIRVRQLSTFICHHASHPWSQHRILIWLLCFSRQFWCSINRADYTALRLGFITTHQLPMSYDFHNYMLRSIEEEFRDIVGISAPLWIFAILCIVLGFHGTQIYFWLSFLPAILAVEIIDRYPWIEVHHFNLRDELFWFGNPRFLLRFIQFVLFQNAFELALFFWSLWESKGSSCFMENHSFIVIRLTFGIVSPFWCSFVTFPLYVIVAQMGSRFKEFIISENVREALHGWQRKAMARNVSAFLALPKRTPSTTSSDSAMDEMDRIDSVPSSSLQSLLRRHDASGSGRHASAVQN